MSQPQEPVQQPSPLAGAPHPVALITGASSGIGLALTTHLLSQNWHVLLADLHPPPRSSLSSFPSSCYLYHHTDVSSWSSQSSCFKKCFDHFGRLDFLALNAGIDDRDDVFGSVGFELGVEMGGQDGETGLTREKVEGLKKPDMKTFEVNLLGVYWGVKLGASWMALNPVVDSTSSSSISSTTIRSCGKIAITASDAGLNALPPVPQYTATKHALVGLTRSLAPSALLNNITVNAICPALTPSNLAPKGLLENMPEDTLTKMETIMKAFEGVGRFGDWWEDGDAWGGKGPNGQVVEGRGEEIYWREEVERVGGMGRVPEEVTRVWEETYRERNRRFARENQERGLI